MIAMWLALCVLFLFIAWGALVAPSARSRRMHGHALCGRLYAHRGLHDAARGVPENSLKAFKRAREAGYGVELDVRRTRDGRLVVFHDLDLKRLCGDDRLVSQVDQRELSTLHLLDTEQTIPTFEQALSVLGDTPLIVELKTDWTDKRLAEDALRALKGYQGLYSVESFDPFAMRSLRRLDKGIPRGQLAFGAMPGNEQKRSIRLWLLGNLWVNAVSRPDYVAYAHETDNSRAFRWVMRLFHPLYAAWTVRSQKDLDRLRTRCDMIIFEGFLPDNRLRTEAVTGKESDSHE